LVDLEGLTDDAMGEVEEAGLLVAPIMPVDLLGALREEEAEKAYLFPLNALDSLASSATTTLDRSPSAGISALGFCVAGSDSICASRSSSSMRRIYTAAILPNNEGDQCIIGFSDGYTSMRIR
jgi:hypothetical protein